jgi:alpha-methylacyl-CoA racemase
MLGGITVLDLATVGPAARTSRWLADYGARVVKIGAPPAQHGVQITPPFYAYAGHRGMQRALLDLKTPAGVDAFLRLAANADVVIESFRPGVMDRLGIGYDAVKTVSPRVVYCSTTGYGQDGPHAQWAGHDLNYLGMGGYLDCTGRDPSGGPALPGATIGDGAGGGMHAVIAILAALVQRAATGEGAYLDVAVADGVVALMSLAIDEYLATGEVPGPRHGLLTGRFACYDVYECRDGRWLTVAAIEPRFWANLCRALGCEQWSAHQTDDDAQDTIRADLRAAFAQRDRDEWVKALGPADTCVAPVSSIPEVATDPHLTARHVFVDAERVSGQPDHETELRADRSEDATVRSRDDGDSLRQVGWVLAGMDRGQQSVVREPTVSDTDALLVDAGLDAATVAQLRSEGVIA